MPLIALLAAQALAASIAARPYRVSDVAQIDVSLWWLGLPGEIEKYDAILKPSGHGFVSTSTFHLTLPDAKTDQDRTSLVAAERVAKLLQAVAAPVRRAPVAADFGATPQWLESHAERAFADFLSPGWAATGGFYTQAQRSLYLRSFTDPNALAAALLHYYSAPPWTDDYPYLTFDVRFKNWQHLTISSQQQKTLMLPWSISTNGTTYKTYDPEISAAARGLLPAGTVRYERLSASYLLQQMSDLVGQYIRPRWEKTAAFDVERLTAPLEKEYGVRIEQATTNCCNDRPVWGADLRFPNLPSTVTASVELPVANNAFTDTSGIPAAKRFAEQTYAIPWLRRFLGSHPGVTVEVLLEKAGRTHLDEQQQRDLLADLRAAGQAARAAAVKPNLAKAFKVLIEEQYRSAQWVVFADSTMLLWDYYAARSPSTVMDLDPARVAGKPCARPSSSLCSGLMLDPEGAISDASL